MGLGTFTLSALTAAIGVLAPAATGATPAQADPFVTTFTPDFVEGSIGELYLAARTLGVPVAHGWRQVDGPRVPLDDLGLNLARVDVSQLQVAVDVELVFELQVDYGAGPLAGQVAIRVRPADMRPVFGMNRQIGGATTAVATFEAGGARWALFNVGGRLSATRVDVAQGPVHSIQLPGRVKDLVVVDHGGARYALAASGKDGIAVVDVTDPAAMQWMWSAHVNYFQGDLSWTEGGGDILFGQEVRGLHGDIAALATDGTTLWIANASFGVQRALLANVLNPDGPVLEPDGTLQVDAEAFTLLFAGETPWGAPLGLELVGDRLFVAREFLGLSIHDAMTLATVGRYNLYTDVTVSEDWFVDMDVAQEVQPGFLDPATGMPDCRQASYEIQNSHGSGSGGTFPTPWADFDRYGKYYYKAQDVDVVQLPSRSIAYIAYGLGGLVAVDVTGFEQATPTTGFLVPSYLGYAPGVPAHGSDEFIGAHNDNIFPHFGAGMLVEAGVIDVTVTDGYAYYTDHFAGLVVLAGADDPAVNWRGAQAPYDNDNGTPGDHNPDYEFVTSYDMSPYDPLDHESLPTWMYEAPCVVVTGEIGGHGNTLAMSPDLDVVAAGQVDAIVCLGAGGLSLVDLSDFSASALEERFELLRYFPTTDEVGAAPNRLPTQAIAIGHTQGVTASERYAYVVDGPHGLSAWRIVDAQGYPTDDVHLVANTVQDEYPVTVGGRTILPATHAYGAVYDPSTESVLTLCQTVGLRRVPVAGVELGWGRVGRPLLLGPDPTDVFEHNGAYGKVQSMPKQDHAYDVVLEGDLAFVADGGNGLTIYDLTCDPTDLQSGFFVGNLGGAAQNRPLLGRSTGVALWVDPSSGTRYALLAAGPYGIGVVNAADPTAPTLIKRFEPIKLEDNTPHKADGRCVDVFVMGDYAYFSYDSFGVLCYSLQDLIEPLPAGVDPTEIWRVQGGTVLFDYRPVAVGEFRLREDATYHDLGGGALNMTHTEVDGEPILYVAYGDAGVVKLDWTDPQHPAIVGLARTAGECSAIAISGGRLYVADGAGGFVVFK